MSCFHRTVVFFQCFRSGEVEKESVDNSLADLGQVANLSVFHFLICHFGLMVFVYYPILRVEQDKWMGKSNIYLAERGRWCYEH